MSCLTIIETPLRTIQLEDGLKFQGRKVSQLVANIEDSLDLKIDVIVLKCLVCNVEQTTEVGR